MSAVVCVCVCETQACQHKVAVTHQTDIPFIYLEFQVHGVVGRTHLTLDKDESTHEQTVVHIKSA